MVTKSLDNIVGNLWQQRQESSGSSMGNQSPHNGDLSDGDPEPSSPARESSPDEVRPEGGGGNVRLKDPRDLIKDDFKPDDPRSILANLPSLPALEAFRRHGGDFLSSPQSFLAAANLRLPPSTSAPSFPLARPPSQPPTPSSQSSSSPVQQSFGSSQQNWSFEEQFKQLYEIDDNPKRKEFLDELFFFMQKRGTPINRLPIMAKQVLDLYELYNLVVARGGLVEVINKKLWQEIIKGLGLPSSITSAAFTLRTQYTKYLYPFECKLKNLSNPNELQAAIEGNKREGRRSSYGTYPDMIPTTSAHLPLGHPLAHPQQISPMSLMPPGHRHPSAFNGNGTILPPTSRSPPRPGNGHDPLSALEMTRLALWKMYNQSGAASPDLSRPPLPNFPGLPSDLFAASHQDKALNLQMAAEQRKKEEIKENDNNGNHKEALDRTSRSEEEEEDIDETSMTPPPTKKFRPAEVVEDEEHEEEEEPARKTQSGLPGANIKISSRGDSKNGDGSLVVSMEINGTTYQGVLFAQPVKHRSA